MTQIQLTPDIAVDLIYKNIKNIHLAVYPPFGNVRLAVPLDTPEEVYKMFAISKLSWIKKNQRILNQQERQSKRQFKERESHYFLGKRYLLRVKDITGTPKVSLSSMRYLDIFAKPDSNSTKHQVILDNWYRSQLLKIVQPLITKWSQKLGVELEHLQIRKMKRIWGSCNSDKSKILLNLELIKKPQRCIEYIVLHELLHLIIRNHNDQFTQKLDFYMPNWRFVKAELNALPLNV